MRQGKRQEYCSVNPGVGFTTSTLFFAFRCFKSVSALVALDDDTYLPISSSDFLIILPQVLQVIISDLP